MKSLRTVLLISAILLSFAGCKKNKAIPSSRKFINSFVFTEPFNHGLGRDVEGTIVKDTIKVLIPVAADIKALIPDIVHEGVSISPAQRTPQDFTNPVRYTVTAADGSMQAYVVVVRYSNTTKDITSFILKKSDNALLTADITGIISGDVIELPVPVGVSLGMFTPSITHTGKIISPGSQVAHDFSKPVDYIVEAEDGSNKRYTVIAGWNATVYIGSNDGFLYALNAITGKLRWKYGTNAEIYSTPTLTDGVLYVTSVDGYLYAIDPGTGKLKWKRGVFDAGACSPVVSNGAVYLASNYIFALQAATGNTLWMQMKNYLHSNPVVSGGNLYVTGFVPGLECYDAITGVRKWWVDAGIVRGNPALVDNTLYLGSEFRRLMAVDATTGAIKWQYSDQNPGSFAHSPTVYNDAVFIGGSDKLFSFNKVTGKLNWSVTIEQNTFLSPVAADNVVYSASSRGYVNAIDAIAGTVKWRTLIYANNQNTSPPYIPHVAVANGAVFVGAYDGYVYSLDAANGGVQWRFRTNGAVFSGACVVDNNGSTFHAGISGAQH